MKSKVREKTLGNQAAMDLLSKTWSILLGTEVPKGRQARAAAFKMGRELSGDGLKRCCGGRRSILFGTMVPKGRQARAAAFKMGNCLETG